MANRYWYKDGADANWSTLTGNWWDDIAHSIQAGSLPTSGDELYLTGATSPVGGPASPTEFAVVSVQLTTGYVVDANIEVQEGGRLILGTAGHIWSLISATQLASVVINGTSTNTGEISADTFTLNGTSYNAGTFTGPVTFNDDSFNQGVVVGECTFNDSSYNTGAGNITGNCVFTDTTFNSATITGNVSFTGAGWHTNAGTINGDATFTATTYSNNPCEGTVSGTVLFTGTPFVTFSISGASWTVDSSGWSYTGTPPYFIFNDTSTLVTALPFGSGVTFNDTSASVNGVISGPTTFNAISNSFGTFGALIIVNGTLTFADGDVVTFSSPTTIRINRSTASVVFGNTLTITGTYTVVGASSIMPTTARTIPVPMTLPNGQPCAAGVTVTVTARTAGAGSFAPIAAGSQITDDNGVIYVPMTSGEIGATTSEILCVATGCRNSRVPILSGSIARNTAAFFIVPMTLLNGNQAGSGLAVTSTVSTGGGDYGAVSSSSNTDAAGFSFISLSAEMTNAPYLVIYSTSPGCFPSRLAILTQG